MLQIELLVIFLHFISLKRKFNITMNFKNSRKIIVAAALLMIVIGFSSCNRGYGCPYELKTAVKVISPIIK